MAKVSVQVIVDRQQVDKLSADLDKLNGKKINVGTKEFTHDLQDAGRAATELQGKLTKTVEVFQDDRRIKAVREYKNGIAETTRETTKLVGKNKDVVQTQTQITHNIEKEEAAQRRATQATQEGNAAVKQQGLLYDILGRSLTSFIARMTAYRAVYAGIRAITNGFREALETMKAVDDEMVAVRKVTGFDQYQMAAIEKESYRVATKYGANASDYMEGVAEFARAGYLELSGALAELSQKTQIVGDTTAEVANQFLLSVDKAYKFEGSISKLSAVLDGADIINNKYATSVEKIAEGLGIVAPVAAQMHVGVDELTAALGTITAVTQRSGSEAARALRAIFLNIVGDTKTEIEEGVTWTTGEIAGLQDVIKTYAKDAYDAAQATGSIIDPMEAIRGLSESMKDGLLTEQKLMEMVSDIGGKLRTSQLIALIENFDMYESMLQDYANSAGTVDREVENAMDSWTRKANVLKNTWTEFVRTGLDSKVFKGALDALTWFVERLGTLPGLLTRLIPLIVGLKLHDMAKNMNNAAAAASNMAVGVSKVSKEAAALNKASVILIAISLAWSAITHAIEDAKIKHEKMVQAIYDEADAAKESTDNMLSLYADFNSAKEGSDALTESAKKLAEALGTDIPEGAEKAGKALTDLTIQQVRAYLDDQYEAVKTAKEEFASIAESATSPGAFDNLLRIASIDRSTGSSQIDEMWSALLTNPDFYTKRGPSGIRAQNAAGEWYDVDDGIFDFTASGVETLGEYRAALEEIVEKTQELARTTNNSELLNGEQYLAAKQYLADTAEAFDKMNKAASDYDAAEVKLKFLEISSAIRVDSAEAYDDLIKRINLYLLCTDEEREAMVALAEQYYPQYTEQVEEAAGKVDEHTDAVKKETESLYENQHALDENASASERAAAAKKDAEAAARKFCDALFDETGELTEAGKAALEASQYLADLTQAELNARLEAAKANYASLRAQLAAVSSDALKAAYALAAFQAASNPDDPIIDDQGRTIWNESARLRREAGGAAWLLRQIQAVEAEMNSITVQASKVEPYTSSYSSSSSSSSSGKSSGSGKGSGSGGKSSSSSTEDKRLTELKNRVTLLKSELSLMKERGDSEESQIAKMREIQNALKAEWEYLKSIKGDQATINGLMQEWWNIENSVTSMMDEQAKSAQAEAEALQKALEAQLALNNALKDRSVRYYNAKTGQWEWGANQQNVQSAYSAYQSAIAGLPEDQRAAFAKQGIAMTGYGLSNSIAEFMNKVSGGKRGSVYNYGSTYNLGSISLSEAQAKGMSVYDLANLSNSLAIHS